MTAVVVVLLVVAAVLILFFVGGMIGARRHYATGGADWRRHVSEADRALEEARAADRGWDREHLEAAARIALHSERTEHGYEDLHLVLVDDRPGVEEDRAEMMATGPAGTVLLRLARRSSGWEVERIDSAPAAGGS
ncbi:MAG: hypothetical protein ACR2LY_02915 [Thermoleophilaceae bacterium]